MLIYPNPLNPKKYVVLNSGFTFREYDYLNNARQVPKLPDYAVIDVTTPPNSRHPGKVVRAGFFGEKWELQADDGAGRSDRARPYVPTTPASGGRKPPEPTERGRGRGRVAVRFGRSCAPTKLRMGTCRRAIRSAFTLPRLGGLTPPARRGLLFFTRAVGAEFAHSTSLA